MKKDKTGKRTRSTRPLKDVPMADFGSRSRQQHTLVVIDIPPPDDGTIARIMRSLASGSPEIMLFEPPFPGLGDESQSFVSKGLRQEATVALRRLVADPDRLHPRVTAHGDKRDGAVAAHLDAVAEQLRTEFDSVGALRRMLDRVSG